VSGELTIQHWAEENARREARLKFEHDSRAEMLRAQQQAIQRWYNTQLAISQQAADLEKRDVSWWRNLFAALT
jgi:hypothetical protein